MKTLIFDFDGTIADTFSAAVRIANELAPEYGLDPITDPEAIKRLKNKRPQELLLDLCIPKLKVSALIIRARSILRSRMDSIGPIGGMVDVLTALRANGYALGILSSNSKENMHFFLEKHRLTMFSFVHSESSIFGKQRALKSLMKKYSLDAREMWYIGDEVRDIEGAKKAGVCVAAVTWGYNGRAILEKQNPNALIDRPEQLLNIFGNSL